MSDRVSVLLVVKLTERKIKQSKMYVSYTLVGLGHYIITGKIITSSNSLLPAKSSFSSILLKSLITITLSLERLQNFSTKC